MRLQRCLGDMMNLVRNRSWLWWTCWTILATAIAAIVFTGNHFIWRYHIKRYQVVRPGVFYRVAQPSEYGVHYLVKKQGVKTIVSLQLYRPTLKKGLYDPGDPDGSEERHYVEQLGAKYLEWPQGNEACWPWPTPWIYEQFFALVDEPANWPIAVHCMGGRHRTGTLSALFRIEYDRWPAERALAEMYSFQFGLPLSLHEHNLRTYLPRPHPSPEVWHELVEYWQPLLEKRAGQLSDYEQLVRAIRFAKTEHSVQAALEKYLSEDRPFALCLAQRVINQLEEPLAALAAERASAALAQSAGEPAEW
ncbi:MAG: tyrosine-protein phosphatase, partial [Planctomycetaceae bacterium]|nr:tyrosine-protein phosphatase [Planctomycetaceae bacterium]